MSKAKAPKRQKGTFTGLSLSVSKKYIFPASRKSMILLGGLGCVVVSGYFVFDSSLLDNNFISSGPLSSNHASLENDCSNCHAPFASVTNEKCSSCHEPANSKFVFYSFEKHYKYRTTDGQRILGSKAAFVNRESACFICHQEHSGRPTSIKDVADSNCLKCHEFGRFPAGHPEFEFARNKTPDDANLKFNHVEHVLGYVGKKDPEQTCDTCHSLEPGGKHFRALDFESQCENCHGKHQRENIMALSRRNNPCQQCHLILGVQVAPVQKDQRVLERAEFSHAPHILLQGCLDCHTEIAMGNKMSSQSPDEASTQNIPKIENCKSCHSAASSSNRCITCHAFHPDTDRRFSLATF